jgi:hypothetical protein
MFAEECPFKVVRTNGSDEVLARAANCSLAERRLRPRSGCIRKTCWNIGAVRKCWSGVSRNSLPVEITSSTFCGTAPSKRPIDYSTAKEKADIDKDWS